MKPTISTKLLFYRIILVCFSKKALLIHVLAPPHWQKTDTIFQKYGNFESRWSPTTKNRPTKNLICLYIAKFVEKFKQFRKFWSIRKKFWGGGAEEGAPGGWGPNGSLCPGRQKPSLRPCLTVHAIMKLITSSMIWQLNNTIILNAQTKFAVTIYTTNARQNYRIININHIQLTEALIG